MEPLAAFRALGTEEGRQDPYPLYEAIRAHGDLVPVKPGTFVAVGYRECARILRDPRLQVQDGTAFDRIYPDWRAHSSVRAFTDSMLYSNPPVHGRQRGTVNTEFTPQQVARLRPVIVETVAGLLDRVDDLGAGGSAVDLMDEFATRLPIAVVSAMLGFDEDRVTWFRDLATAIAVATDGFGDADALATADAAMDELAEHFEGLIARKRGCPAGDIVSSLVGLHDADSARLSHQELIGNMMLLLTAGFETTAFLTGDGALMAIANPGYAARLRTDDAFTERYVEEVLRVEPPVHVTSRWATEDLVMFGTRIPAGARVVVVLAAGNRDPRRYPDPGRFDPSRVRSQPLSFGGGIHFCLGAALARLEARIALPMLFRRFPGIALAGTATYRDRWVIRGLRTLPVTTGAEAAAIAS
ncbi:MULTISPECIES: cytochrome P450 [Actinokineospora]|uniref:Cytochrome P450 n=1 Tax=Actinokineospora fastidiosa TaxID=1816 RepID=A0A918GSA6_9PSEU|nr:MULTISPECIES: cytochrome P450 [Actinokineospora]UVS81486.1 6-deoxyerythronolide B hydroxylase [Actinokineospora sp. UTMC 2448]GGS57761.1 cytochrome P450 [Actinokineospora fastidiosa]